MIAGPDGISEPAVPEGEETDAATGGTMPLVDHLRELRSRVIRSLLAVGVGASIAFVFSKRMIEALLWPLSSLAPEAGSGSAIFTSALEVLFVRLELAVWCGVILAFPYLAWHAWAFAAPGLYGREKMAVIPVLFAMPVLAGAGLAMVYFLVLPLVVRFAFTQEIPTADLDVAFLPRVREYVGLAMGLFKAFALAFQLPVVLAVLARVGLVDPATLARGRKYALIGIFACAMFLTPPDPFSQTLLAVPVYILYEMGILAARLAKRRG